MFKLHDKTRRLLTLLIFLLLGPALLFAVVIKGCSRHSVGMVAGWEALLTDALGKRVEIESVCLPAPGVVRFSQMRVLDPETNEVFLQIPQWELIEHFGEMPQYLDPAWMSQAVGEDGVVSPQEDIPTKNLEAIRTRMPCKRGLFASFGFAWSNLFSRQPRYLLCEIPQVSCYDTAIPQVKDALLELAAKQSGKKASRNQTGTGLKPVVVFVGSIDVYCTDGKPGNPVILAWEVIASSSRQSQTPKSDCVTILDACFEFRPGEEQTTCQAIFQHAGQPSDAKPFQLAVSCWRHPVALTRVQFTSGDNEVPNRILTGLDTFFSTFGTQSRFNGNIIAEKSVNQQKNRTRSLELNQVVMTDVTLDSLLSKSITFRLDGMADKVILDSARFHGESNDAEMLRLEYAQGKMLNAKGLASWPGLLRFVQGTKLQISPWDASPPNTDIYFRNGIFAFQIDSQGIQLYSARDQSQQNLPLLVIDNLCAVFLPNPGYVIRYVDLLASLAQPNTQQIPLMPETQHLISTLPITIERDVTTAHTPPPQIPPLIPANLASQKFPPHQLQPVPQPQSIWPQAELQLPPLQENAPTMMPVPSLTQAMPIEPYQQPPQLAMGHGSNDFQQPNSSVATHPLQQDDSYTPAQRPSESQFFMSPRDSSNLATPTSQPTLPPLQQPSQSMLTQLHAPQPAGVPYRDSPQFLAANQPPNKVVIPTLSGNSNRVQTDSTSVAQPPFNHEMPATPAPYQQTQVASVPQPQHYDNMATTMPYAATPSASASPSPFGLLSTNPQ